MRVVDAARWCSHHAQLVPPMFEPVAAVAPGSRLCRWCYDWQRDTPAGFPALPPEEILERRARGHRITSQVLAEYLVAQRRGAKGKRRKGKRAA